MVPNRSEVRNVFRKFKDLKVLLVGETIIDDYFFVDPNGVSIKDPIISTKFVKKERYLGGVFAIANHLANFVKEVHVVTLLGDKNENKEFIKSKLNSKIKCSFFTKKGAHTIIKERFVDSYKLVKLFKMEYLDESPMQGSLKEDILGKIKKIYDDYDLILINDFGHGLLDEDMVNEIASLNKFVGVNIQTKNSNYGFNLVTKCKQADFITLNQIEIRLLFRSKNESFKVLFDKLIDLNNYKEILLTLGKNGSMFYRNKVNSAPALITKPIDTIGAGDAVFGITSLMSFCKVKEDLVPLISNAAGAAATTYMGNKESVDLNKILDFFKS